MTASLSAFGALLLPLVVGFVLFRRPWLWPLLVVSATLQAPAVINLGFGGGAVSYGLTAFNLVAVALLLSGSVQWRQARLGALFQGSAGLNLRLWLAYGGMALAGSVVLPQIFANTPVYLLLQKDSFESGPTALRWTLSNLAQAGNLLLLLLLLVYVRLQQPDPAMPKRLLTSFGVALVASALIGLQQRLAWQGVVPMFDTFWASNLIYAQNFVSYAGPIARVSWPFTEPAYGSAWYATVFGGCLAVFFIGRYGMVALLGMLFAAFALLNSLGATGLMAIGAYLLVLGCVLVIVFAKAATLRWQLVYQSALASLVLACCGLAVYLVLRHYSLLAQAQSAVNNLLVGANPTIWGDIRPVTNWHALSVLRDTYGLGVGLGSNRASSYLASLFSNTGLLGGLAFLAALGHLGWLLLRAVFGPDGKVDSGGVFFLGALVAASLAVGTAIPDQNWPVYWVLIISAFAWVNQWQSPVSASSGPSHAANPAS
jgi:hypothetical protein